MNWFKKLLTTAIWISIAQTSQAQQHYNAWFRSTLSVPVGKKFKIDNELQHRRQNGFNNADMFDRNLMFTYRNWVHYHHNSAIKFSLSPFAYFSNYKIIQKQADENATPNNEIRFSAAVELQHEILKRFLWRYAKQSVCQMNFVRFLLFQKFQLYELCIVNQIQKQ